MVTARFFSAGTCYGLLDQRAEHGRTRQSLNDQNSMPEEMTHTANQKSARICRIDAMELPESYRTSSAKEKVMLEYVDRFGAHFVALHPERRPLMLCPRNECGSRKFICTTIRPTQLPFGVLYEHEGCARFVADFMEYEELGPQASIPTHVVSPSTALEWQAGDCFDLAQLLASLLLAVGYDAYVVSGYAPCVMTDDGADSMEPAEHVSEVQKTPASPSKYAVPPRRVLESSYLKQKANRAKVEHTFSRANEATLIRDAPPVKQQKGVGGTETSHDKRVHAWVLLLSGKRSLGESSFIEPSTGRSYPLDSSPFYSIESVWNASNYWVNMQTNAPLAKIDFDLTATAKWENLLCSFDIDALQLEEPSSRGTVERVQIEMPPTWVDHLTLDRKRFDSRYPRSHKVIIKRGTRTRVEKYCEYAREDGLVERVTLFSNAEMTDDCALETREMYANRKDRLSRRLIKTSDDDYSGKPSRVDMFEPGRPKALKRLVEVEGERCELHFYDSARFDGLQSRIEAFGVVTEQHFSGERAPLVYRSATYHTGQGGESGVIREMKEKFRRSPEVDANSDIREQTFTLAPDPMDNKIDVIYHYGPDRVTAPWRTYSNKVGHANGRADPFSPAPTERQMLDDFQRLQQAERECLKCVRESDRQARKMLATREDEEDDIRAAMDTYAEEGAEHAALHNVPAHLNVSPYDTHRNRFAVRPETAKEEEKAPHDYLTAFLPRKLLAGDPPLTRKEALAARDACLKSLKERLVERANIVQNRLDQENAALHKVQEAFRCGDSQTHTEHTHTEVEEAEYERFCQEALFRIQIIERRLDRHSDMSLRQYSDMDNRLRADPRLVAMTGVGSCR